MSVVLSEHLPLLATAPAGIQKLRGLILELAVRGKLVLQDPNDEPASELLKRIAKERAELEAEGTYKKSKATLISAEEQPFDAPNGWVWIRLTQLGEFRGGKTPSTNRSEYWDGPIPWVSPKDMKSLVVSQTEDYVTDLAISDGLQVIPASSVLTVVRSGILRRTVPVAINSVQCTINQDLKALCLVLPGMARYVQLLIRGFERQILETLTKVGTTVESIKFEEFSQHPFPLPPLDEQLRILAKVDELMALCDRLEAEQSDAESVRAKLVETLFGRLIQSTDAADFAVSWQRLAEHFDTLFNNESSVDALERTILQLAVMGKLVPQDPNDEPASLLLKRIALERDRLEAEGKVKKSKLASPPVPEATQPFVLPKGWEWIQFDEIINPDAPISYGVLVPGPDTSNGVPFVRIGDLAIEGAAERPEKTIARQVDEQYSRTRLSGGEILMGVVGSIGKLGVAPMSWKGANIARAICRISPTRHVLKRFVLLLLQSETMQNAFAGDTRTLAQPTLNVGLIRSAKTPLPPLGEQHRIVAKVNELTALCDRLKADLAESRRYQEWLASSLIESALKTV